MSSYASQPLPDSSTGTTSTGGVKAIVSFALGLAGLVTWCFPMLGFPSMICGLILGIVDLRSGKREFAIAGITLCATMLLFSIVNAAVGVLAMVPFVPPSRASDSMPSNTSPQPTAAPTDDGALRYSTDFEKGTDPRDNSISSSISPQPTRVSTDDAARTYATDVNKGRELRDKSKGFQDAVNSTMGQLLQAAQQQHAYEQQRRYEQFQENVQRASLCGTCGGTGSYRYVDGLGNLVVRSCPTCSGLGRRF